MTTSDSARIAVESLTCGYDKKVVLGGCSFRIESGEVVALIGPNGSGKSTLMKTIAGAIRPIAGTVKLIGDDLMTLSKKDIAKRLGYVPQIESPAFDFKVRDVVLMGRLPHSERLFETREDLAAADAAIDRADCRELADRPMSELSGGEGQRVRIARALAQEAPILLMDEPTTHLDVRHQIDIGRLVKSLAADGLAVLVAVHDLNWAAAFATRAIVLSDGGVVLDEPMAQALESPVVDRAFEVEFRRVREGGLRLLANDGG